MGDEQRQGGLAPLVLFLDENHCRNRHLIQAIEDSAASCGKHLDYFAAGTADTEWLPLVAERGWVLLTTDTRIRHNQLEREAVRLNRLKMFYFSRNNLAGFEMGIALRKAMPEIRHLVQVQSPPFTASISKNGEVRLRDTFQQSREQP